MVDQGTGLWPTDIAALYGITADMDARNQTVGVISLGGGYDPNDLDLALKGMSRRKPNIIPVSVSGGVNNFQHGSPADIELSLDLQILCSLLPSADIVIYFAQNGGQALADAIEMAVKRNANRPSVLSISFGQGESSWLDTELNNVNTALEAAAQAKITVLAASGDHLATNGNPDGMAHVCFPASNPIVFAVGGTQFTLSPDQKTKLQESAWDDAVTHQGTGGGISNFFDVPDYQKGLGLPTSVSTRTPGRGIPDFAAAASPNPGYRIVVNGKEKVQSGTSAATPLWAAIVAIANSRRNASLGDFHAGLYSSVEVCSQITQGNNKVGDVGYSVVAGETWNACAGLGVPIGARTINALCAMP